MHNSFQAKNYRAFRARLFAGLGLTGIIPVLHSCVINYDIRAVHTALWLDFVMGLLYLVRHTDLCVKGVAQALREQPLFVCMLVHQSSVCSVCVAHQLDLV